MDRLQWNKRYSEKDLLWKPSPHPVLEDISRQVSPGHALDLAAGEGRNALALAEAGWKVTAVDFADVAVARGGALADELGLSVDWHVADLTVYQPGQRQFDLVYLAFLHVPWQEMRTILKKAASAVCPGGLILVIGHDRTNLTEGVGGPQDSSVLYSPDDITPLLDGFDITRAERVRNPVDHGTEKGFQIDCVVTGTRRL
jgi:SAM-dependent methyltransferase